MQEISITLESRGGRAVAVRGDHGVKKKHRPVQGGPQLVPPVAIADWPNEGTGESGISGLISTETGGARGAEREGGRRRKIGAPTYIPEDRDQVPEHFVWPNLASC